MVGKSLAHYQILEKLGAGGMGVVYKARDTHLDRFVAIKVLPPEKVADPDRKRRFVQEAKAASALNHPNIVTIHDIALEDRTDFIVMEYVAGETLDKLIPRNGMRLSVALKYAVQIANALVRAHGAGIIHRDLKPSNVIVGEHGLVKLLDFGLAKLTEAAGPDAETEATGTAEGAIIGTAAYMSPEQAEGKRIDTRSDIFCFGSMFYEMLTGQRAFRGDTRVSIVASILREDPKPISQVVEGLPQDVDRIIRRCLRKDPDRRFQAMPDLKVALEELKEESDSTTGEARGVARPRSRRSLVWASAFIGALAIATVVIWFLRPGGELPEAALAALPLTSYPGSESGASFSPDGSQVAFAWNGEKEDNSDIYVKLIGAEPPLRLTTNAAVENHPAWSPDGRWIAFCRFLPQGGYAVVLISPIGGPERMLTELDYPGFGPSDPSLLAWSPDSRWLAVVDGVGMVRYSLDSGEKHRLTSPPTGSGEDGCPAFSTDGRTLAFSRWSSWSNSDLYLVDLSQDFKPTAEPKRLTFGNWVAEDPAWTVDGRSLVFSASGNLWRMDVAGKPQRLALTGMGCSHPAISLRGNRLAWTQSVSDVNIWRIEIPTPGGKAKPPQKFIASTHNEDPSEYSPDGKKISFLSDRSGSWEVWVCDSDGSNAVQLTSLGGASIGSPARWSPDGSRLTFSANIEGHAEVYVIGASGGNLQRMTSSATSENPSWPRDGRLCRPLRRAAGGRLNLRMASSFTQRMAGISLGPPWEEEKRQRSLVLLLPGHTSQWQKAESTSFPCQIRSPTIPSSF
jgi:Tol biopolymer transport system component/predicted Ser/Thr protein kinase